MAQMAQADFGWIVFAAFLLWFFRVLQVGARRSARSGARGGEPTRRPAPPPQERPLGGTQREGSELDELLRQLEGRLEAQPVGRPRLVLKPPVGKPATARQVPRPPLSDDRPGSSEVAVDRGAEGEALARQRFAAGGAGNQKLSHADHAGFEARIRSGSGSQPTLRTAAGISRAPGSGFSAATLRDLLVWREILGPPKGLE